MIKIAICDDELLFREQMQKIIATYMELHGYAYQIDLFSSGLELIEKAEKIRGYQAVYLDIGMDELNGIQTAECIRQYSQDIHLVFVTSYFLYALEGYKVKAIRYIMKDNESIEAKMNESLDAIMALLDRTNYTELLSFREGDLEICLDDIKYIESRLHMLFFEMDIESENTYTLVERLDTLEERYKQYGFVRIHKSYLVNLKYIKSISRYHVTLKDETVLNIAKPRYMEVKNAFLSYRGRI